MLKIKGRKVYTHLATEQLTNKENKKKESGKRNEKEKKRKKNEIKMQLK
jgi:hypothetical protein